MATPRTTSRFRDSQLGARGTPTAVVVTATAGSYQLTGGSAALTIGLVGLAAISLGSRTRALEAASVLRPYILLIAPRACRSSACFLDLALGGLGSEESRDIGWCAEAGGGGVDVVAVRFQERVDFLTRAADGHGGDAEELAKEIDGGELAQVEHGDQDPVGWGEFGLGAGAGGRQAPVTVTRAKHLLALNLQRGSQCVDECA